MRISSPISTAFIAVCVLAGVLALSSAPALAAEACPNEQVRAESDLNPETGVPFSMQLPECRAYEMVTPPFKDGARISLRAVSANGSSVLGESNGAFAGTETGADGIEGTLYEFSRSGSGWVVSALSPPASLFPSSTPFASSTDLARTLWGMRRSSQSIYAENLYVREPDGSFVEIGPMVPPSAEAGPPAGGSQVSISQVVYQGASSDLSHVLFQIKGDEAPFWPGDTTEKGPAGALYEYVGTENKKPPELVGLNGEDHLISNCGTVLGGTDLGGEASVDAYNAVSSDGESVFFTSLGHNVGDCEVAAPEVSEVYARLGQDETVAISEPSPGQCRECDTTSRAPAEFQGASEDGSKVFFLTEQELFSGDTTMNLYEYDFDNPNGQKIVRASVGSSAPEVLGVARVSEDGSHVYFVAKGVLASRNAAGKEPEAGKNNLYVFERDAQYPGGHTAFIATLSSESEAELTNREEPCAALSGETKEECEAPFKAEFNQRNAADAEDWSAEDLRSVQATPEGRFLVFRSAADLTPGDTSSEPQVFEYDALTEELVRASTGQAGYAGGSASANAHGSLLSIQRYARSVQPTAAQSDLAVSGDGAGVIFDSAGALTPGAEASAAAGAESVYEYHSDGPISNGDVYLISDGSNALNAEAEGISASGEDVFFQTADPLLALDVDTQYDVYDARVDGGFPALATQAGCEGAACQGAPFAQPSFGTPGSASAPAGDNLQPPSTSPPSKPAPKPTQKPLTRAQKLAKALKTCRRKPKRRRPACERRARRAYAPTLKAKKPHAGGK